MVWSVFKHPVPLCCCRPHPRLVGRAGSLLLCSQLLSFFDALRSPQDPRCLCPVPFALWPFSFPISWPYLPRKFRFPCLWSLPLLRNFFLTCGSWRRAHPCCSASHCSMAFSFLGDFAPGKDFLAQLYVSSTWLCLNV